MARKLIVEIVGDASSLDKALRHASGSVQKFSVGLGTLVKSAAVFNAVEAGFRGVTSAVGASVDEFVQQQQVAAQTTAVLKSTGGAANVTAKQVDALATSISNYSGIDDEAVQAGENMLLTFSRVQNQVGAGNDVFDQAAGTIADLATALNKGAAPSMDQMTAAALQVGKALNDPVRGYTRLQRIGVAFTASQVAQIKGFTRVGDTIDAQRVILAELTREFGGSAREMGRSIPGELNRVRESFRNLGGEIVGTLAPSLTRALEAVNGFVDKLTAARTVHAKLNVVWDGVRESATAAFDQLRDAFNRIDWNQLWADSQRIARSLLDSLVAAFTSVDWARLGTTLGNKVRSLVGPLTEFVKGVNWQKVGKAVIDGLLIALGGLTVALGNFLRRALPALARLWVQIVKAQANLLLGVGKALVQPILDGIGNALNTAGAFLEKQALQLVLKIIEPFTHIPGGIPGLGKVGSLTRELKTSLQETLDELGKSTTKPATDVGVAIGAHITEGIKTAVSGANATRDAAGRTRPSPIPEAPPAKVDPNAATKLAGRRNTWFDAMITRSLDQVQDIPTLKGQIGRLKEIAALVEQRIAVTKDVTRKLTLEDRVRQIMRTIRGDQTQLRQNIADARKTAAQNAADARQAAAERKSTAEQALLDRLQLAVDRTALTATLNDDLKALQAQKAGIEKIIATQGSTLKRQNELLAVELAIKSKQQEIADARKARLDAAKQAAEDAKAAADAAFQSKLDWAQVAVDRAGLTDNLTGELKGYNKELAIINQQIRVQGDTAALEEQKIGILKQIKDAKAQQAQQAEQAATAADKANQSTRRLFKHLNATAFVNTFGAGLTREQKLRLETGLAMTGPGGTLPAGHSGQFTAGITIHGGVHMHGVQDVPGLENQIAKRAKARPHVRRGARG